MAKSTEEALRDMERLIGGTGTPNKTDAPAKTSKKGGFLSRFISIEGESDEADSNKGITPEEGVGLNAEPTVVLPSDAPAALSSKPFADIYTDMGVPTSKCSVDELKAIVSNPALASQSTNVKVLAANIALQTKGVTIDDVLENYRHRVLALNQFRELLSRKVQDITTSNTTSIDNIKKELDEYLIQQNQKVGQLQNEIKEAQDAIASLINRIADEIKDMKAIIEPFRAPEASKQSGAK